VPRALIVNAYATGNWGDAAIVESMVDGLRCAGFDRVTIAPVDWRAGTKAWRELGVDDVVPPLVSFFDAPRLLRRPRAAMLGYTVGRLVEHRMARAPRDPAMRAYRRSDLVLSAGGGYLGGSRSGPNLIKLVNIQAAVAAGRPTVVAPVTINPFSRSVGRLLRWGLGGTSIFVRDRPSLVRLDRLGLAASLVPDLALRAPSLRRVAAAAKPDRLPTRIIGWAPRDYRDEHNAWGSPDEVQRRTLEAVHRVMVDPDQRLRFIPHVRAEGIDDDLRAIDRLLPEFNQGEVDRIEVAEHTGTLTDAVRQYASLDVLVTSRMHAGIFAMAAGTPAMTIGYEPKVHGVMTELGLNDRVVNVDSDTTVDELAALVGRLGAAAERSKTVSAFNDVQGRFEPFDRCLADARAAT
jgi:polysaccharide pyruvyl transferase WcaK-like protein